MAQNKKNADKLGAALVFIDESGFLPTPILVASWGPSGQTPVITVTMGNWKKVSSVSALAMSPKRKHLRLFVGVRQKTNISALHLQRFFTQQVLAKIPTGPIVFLWDRSPVHKGHAMTEFLAQHPRLHREYLPAYAPELNPVEFAWSYCKRFLANGLVENITDLCNRVQVPVRRLQRNQSLLWACIHASELPWM